MSRRGSIEGASMQTLRLESLSEGFFAMILTLLVIERALPHEVGQQA
jgi:uncharacterized membrane protein